MYVVEKFSVLTFHVLLTGSLCMFGNYYWVSFAGMWPFLFILHVLLSYVDDRPHLLWFFSFFHNPRVQFEVGGNLYPNLEYFKGCDSMIVFQYFILFSYNEGKVYNYMEMICVHLLGLKSHSFPAMIYAFSIFVMPF